MTKKTLEEKTKLVGFWTFGGVFWYLVVAFFLKSKYPIFNYDFDPSTAYDVIKDALTLAGTFLAPIAAFVLFTDWREQHRAIKIENESDSIHRELSVLLSVLRSSIDSFQKDILNAELLFSELKKIDGQFENLVPHINTLGRQRQIIEVDLYMKKLNEILDKFFEFKKKFKDISYEHQYFLHEPNKEYLDSQMPEIKKGIYNVLRDIRRDLLDVSLMDMTELYHQGKLLNL